MIEYQFSGVMPPSCESFGVCDFPNTIDRLVFSFNGRRKDSGRIELHVAVGGRVDSPWARVAVWGTPIVDPFETPFDKGPPGTPAEWIDPPSRIDSTVSPQCLIDVDTIRFSEPIHTARWRLRWHGERPPMITRLVACGWHNREAFGEQASRKTLPVLEAAHKLDRSTPLTRQLPFLSQFQAGTDRDGHLCAPASLAMAVGAFGHSCTVAEAARRTFDPLSGLFGNWVNLAAAASEFGLSSWVEHHGSLEELAGSLHAGFPVICSIAYKQGELTGAPVPASAGHLLVVKGMYEKQGRQFVDVHDPAGQGEQEGIRFYSRDEFERAWLGHGGIAIHIEPQQEPGP